jgi:hypothetical protein
MSMSTPISNSAEAAHKDRRERKSRTALVMPLRYGLPCVNCRIYYEAALTECPICGCTERASPAA